MAITYTPTTNFGAKDSLPTNDPDKVIKGSEFTTEFTALQTAFSLAAPNASPTFTGTVTIPTADINGGAIDGTTIGGTTPAAASFTTVSATGNITVGGTVDGRDVAADGTKLDGIEAGADVTDTTNVTAAGALMDSELTNIAAVKALNQGVATTDSPSFAGLTATTADINGGTIDGATIGGASAAAGTFTTLNATGGGALTGTWSDLGTVTTVDINGGTIDGVVIGGASAAAGTFTNLTASGTVSFSGATVSDGGTVTTVNIDGGSIDGTIIGAASTAAGSFTTLQADTSLNVDGTVTADGLTIAGNVLLSNEGDELQFNTSSTPVNKIYSDDTYTTNGLTVFAENGVTLLSTNNYLLLDDTGTNEMVLNVDGGERMRVTSTGIDVTGTVTADGLTVDVGSASTTVAVFSGDLSNSWLNIQSGADSGVFLGSNSGTFRLLTSTTNRLAVGSNGDISFYEDTGTTASLVWDSSQTQLKITGRETSRGGGVYAFDVDNSAHSSNLASAGAMRVKGYYGDSFIVNGLGDVSFFDDSGSAKFFWDASAESLGIGTTSPSAPLHIVNATPVIRLEDTSASVSHYINSNNAELRIQSGGALSLRTAVGEAARIDTLGNLLVGKTSTALGTVGHEFGASGYAYHTRDGNNVLYLNRNTSDGDIAKFYKDGTTVGSIGSHLGAYLYIASASNVSGIGFYNNSVRPVDSNGSASDADQDLGASTIRWKDLYLSGGVYLGGTGAANLLDDYEEGTWTPVQGATWNFSQNLSSSSGTYVKIGNVVYVYAQLVLAGASTPTGAVVVSGLPFSSAIVAPGSYTSNDAANSKAYGNLYATSTSLVMYDAVSGTTSNIWNLSAVYTV